MRDNKLAGSDKFFNEMEPLVLKNINKMNLDEFSNVLYAYSVRGLGSKEFHKIVLHKLHSEMSNCNNYHILFNISWYLMFTDNLDKSLWQKYVDQVQKIDGKMPLIYYRAFKLAAHYIIMNDEINSIELYDFRDRFFYAEQYYNYTKYESFFESEWRYIHFKSLLNSRLGLFPMISTCFHNLFIVNYMWETKKIGINLFFDRDYVPKSNPLRLNEHARMHSKMMACEDWIILDLTWEDYINIGNQEERDNFIQNWYDKSTQTQIEKGITKSCFKDAKEINDKAKSVKKK